MKFQGQKSKVKNCSEPPDAGGDEDEKVRGEGAKRAGQLGGRPAGLETRDTADLEVCGTKKRPTTLGCIGGEGASGAEKKGSEPSHGGAAQVKNVDDFISGSSKKPDKPSLCNVLRLTEPRSGTLAKRRHAGGDADEKGTGKKRAGGRKPVAVALRLRGYQIPVFDDRSSGIVVLHWSRQIGKSYVLAAWAVDRLITKLGKNDAWLITVLSNSRDNGAEFVRKCQDVCNRLGVVMEASDDSTDLKYDNMRMEVRIACTSKEGARHTGRIKVLAANPRTARGFSGDLILDEFAFHENSNAIWEAAEPILSSNQEFLCRIASTGNGKHNMFYRLCAGLGSDRGEYFQSVGGFRVSRVTRTAAHGMGVPIFDPGTRRSITPEEARQQALDKRAYDQNYECKFNDENMCLLTHELIQQAERGGIGIDEQTWSADSLARMFRAEGSLHAGQDVGRNRDLSVIAVVEKCGGQRRVIAMLRMAGLRLPQQQDQINTLFGLPKFRSISIDMTGLGLGLVEYAQERWRRRVRGVNFSHTEPINDFIRSEGRLAETARVTENMATELLGHFEHKPITLEVALDADALDDLRKPERIVSAGGRVSIAASRNEAGHADHFWALALAIRDAGPASAPVAFGFLPDPVPTIGSLGMKGVYRTVSL